MISAVTFIWAMVIGACAAMALPHLFIGLKDREWKNLLFAVAALGVAGTAFGEMAIMHARTTEEIGRAMRWTHVPLFFLFIGIACFVRAYFGTGRGWILITLIGARMIMLALNFAYPPNVNFSSITALREFQFLGETVAMPFGVLSAGARLGEFSTLLLLIFVIDASLSLWRRGGTESRRRALVVGGSVILFVFVAGLLSSLTNARVVQLPYLISFSFLGVILAMGFELSHDILRAAQTTRQLRLSEAGLRESEERMSLATESAKLGLWVWEIARDEI